MYAYISELLSDKKGGPIFSCLGIWHFCYILAFVAIISVVISQSKKKSQGLGPGRGEEEKESLQKQLDEKNHMISALNQQLETREIHLKEAGTIADAAFKLNGVYSAVERAAEQYLDNLQTLYEKEKDVYAKKEKEVYQKCRALIDATYQKCDAVKADTVKTCKALILSTEKRCKEKEEEAEEKSRLILQQARMNSDAGDFDLSARLEDFCSTEEGFEEIMTFLK